MSQDYDQHIILHHLDDPLRIFYWTFDEAVAMAGPVLLGLLLGSPLIGFMAGAAFFKILRLLKKNYGLDNLKHASYWYFRKNRKRLPHLPESYIREYLG